MTVVTSKDEVDASSIWRKRRRRTNELRFISDYLINSGRRLVANNNILIPFVAHGGSG